MPRAKGKSPRGTSAMAKPRFEISQGGSLFALLTVFMALAAMNSQANLLFAVCGLMIGLGVAAYILGARVLRRLDVQRMLPEVATVGEPALVGYRFSNTKRFWPSLSVVLSELDAAEVFTRQPVAYMLHAGPRTSATATIQLLPKRRGLHALGRYQLGTSFPFGFLRRAVNRRQGETLLVQPAIGRVAPDLLTRCRSAETSGTSMRPRQGGSDEFYGVREYRPGDNPRSISWRRSARTGTLVAREMTQVAPPRLVVLVDTYNADQTAERYAAVEKAIAQGASLVSHGLDSGLSVGLAAWSGTNWIAIHPHRGKRHRRDVLAALARLPLNTRHDANELVESARSLLRPGTTPVLLTPHAIASGWGEDSRSGLIAIHSESEQAARWFTFAADVDFTRCMPIPVAPAEAAAASAPAAEQV